jgi:hypothetical protein
MTKGSTKGSCVSTMFVSLSVLRASPCAASNRAYGYITGYLSHLFSHGSARSQQSNGLLRYAPIGSTAPPQAVHRHLLCFRQCMQLNSKDGARSDKI